MLRSPLRRLPVAPSGLRRRGALALLCALSVAVGCESNDKKNDNDNNNNDNNSAWLVGDHGDMFRLTLDGGLDDYPLQTFADFSAIACKGEATAWVVGEAGTVLVTRDGGTEWESIDVGTEATLTSVAPAEAPPEGEEPVWVVGHDGVALLSPNGGDAWHALELDTDALPDFTGIATDDFGRLGIAVALDGSIWRSEDGGPLAQVHEGAGLALHSVSASHGATHVVAVGDAGLVLQSGDGGLTWTPMASDTQRDLYAVRTAGHGHTLVAVGEAGVVLRIDEDGPHVQEVLAEDQALHGVHLRAQGPGQAVGTNGVVLLTEDAGRTWTPLDIGTDATLNGVDDFHRGGHF